MAKDTKEVFEAAAAAARQLLPQRKSERAALVSKLDALDAEIADLETVVRVAAPKVKVRKVAHANGKRVAVRSLILEILAPPGLKLSRKALMEKLYEKEPRINKTSAWVAIYKLTAAKKIVLDEKEGLYELRRLDAAGEHALRGR